MSTSNNTQVSKLDAIKWLSKRPVITSAGKYTVKVNSCQDFSKVSEDGRTITVAIANFNIMNAFQAGKAKELLMSGDTNGALNQNLSLGIRSTDFRPAKGETVNIIVEEIVTKSGETALLATSVMEIQAKTVSTTFDFSMDEVAETEDVTSMD